MSLAARIAVDRGGFRLEAGLAAESGQVVALLGPNGSGKSTLLGALAGTVPLSAGRIDLDGDVLDDVDAGRRQRPQDRHVGMVVQDYLLFPHLSVLDNVAFGLRARGMPRGRARERATAWVDRMGLAGLERHRPRQLSGGQAQRVAIARALIVEPRLLLLDEPLAALDAGTRPAMRAELRRHLAGYRGCTLIVTHDPLEALVLGDRVVVLERGAVVQEGTPRDLARHPRTDYVARLVGLNLLRGRAGDKTVVLGPESSVAIAHAMSGEVHVVFPPTAVTLSLNRPESSARNAWPGRVADIEVHGDLARVRVEGPVPVLADVTPLALADLGLEAGMAVWASVKASEVSVYPA